MAENKTVATDASVQAYLDGIDDDPRRRDCEALVKLMASASRHPPKMWGSSIVGFGSDHYRYDSGREGDSCLVGFSSRKGDISVYGLNAATDVAALLPKLGRHKAGKGCLYIKRLADIDLTVLSTLVGSAVATTRAAAFRRNPSGWWWLRPISASLVVAEEPPRLLLAP